VTGAAKPAALCKGCKAKGAVPLRQCDASGCGRQGCAHLVSPDKADPTKDLCGGCRLKAHAAKAKAAKEGAPSS
jgi:hypothetical protein